MVNLTALSKRYGDQILFNNVNFQIRPGEKVGLVGPNGAGKTTIFRLITGEEYPDEGLVGKPDKLVIGYFSQDVGEMSGRSVLEEVLADAGRLSELERELARLQKRLEEAEINPMSDEEMMKVVERFGEVQAEFQTLGGYDFESRAKEILTGLGIGPEDYIRPVESFSGGWKMRIALAKILLLSPDLLLMDEPTNHLDLESIEWLETWIKSFPGSLIMTSHDREFMNRIVTRIIEVSNKELVNYSGNYDYYDRERHVRREQLLASHRKQQDMLAKEEEFIARFAARASHAAQVQSRVKKIDKIERIEIPPEERTMDFEFAPAPRSGNDVVVLEDLAKIWPPAMENGREKLVFSNITGMVRRLSKVAVVGVNGAGKSTLLKVIAGQTEATSGKVTIGASVKLGYFSQHSLEVLDARKTVFEEVFERVPNATIGFVRNLLGAFLFSGDDVHKKISVLSGGEKSRVILATLLATPLNFLILDEPTNHLDIKSREVLLKALQKFDGTVMIVSHDRHFLRSLADRVFEVDKGALNIFEGDYDYYRSKRSKA
jgi:ATP-binding cassette subfamily F protein 3